MSGVDDALYASQMSVDVGVLVLCVTTCYKVPTAQHFTQVRSRGGDGVRLP